MQFTELLPRSHIAVPLEVGSVDQAIEALIRRLHEAGTLQHPDEVLKRLREPRTGAPVALTPQVVLPHYRTDAVERLMVALGISPEPLASEGDGEVRIVTLILAPPGATTLYLQTVSALARQFREPGFVASLLRAQSPDDVLQLEELQALRILPRLSVRDIMIHRPDGVPPDTPVRDAVDFMIRNRLRALPVVGEKHEVLGIISEWDVMRGLLPKIPRATDEEQERTDSPPLRVRDVMTRSVLCVPEDMALEEAANLMINKDVEQFPVVAEGKLTGFLTRGDIIRKLFGR